MQDGRERQRLWKAWLREQKVQAFENAVREQVNQSELTGAEGMTETLKFASELLRKSGNLPDSGILST